MTPVSGGKTVAAITDDQRAALRTIAKRETEAFRAATPRSQAWLESASDVMPNGVPVSWMVGFWRHPTVVAVSGHGTVFTDLDGRTYRDFNLCDFATPAGFDPPPVIRAVESAVRSGTHFLLPTVDAEPVARLLARRFGLPAWQVTLSASGATTDALRLARAATARDDVVVFEGKYHGHTDELLAATPGGHGIGLPDSAGSRMHTVVFNDLDALAAVLRDRCPAAVVLEPAMTNAGLVLPQPGFLAGVRELCASTGTLVVADVTHTQFAVPGGGATGSGLDPDIVVGGKGIGGGIPIGVLGVTEALARFLAARPEGDFVAAPQVPTGGTLYGNPVSLAAARAGLSEIFTDEAFARVDALGARLQSGVQQLLDSRRLPWHLDRWGGRCQWRMSPAPPRTASEGMVSMDQDFCDARKVFFANRGIWDAIASAGPSISFAATDDDVDAYLRVCGEFLEECT